MSQLDDKLSAILGNPQMMQQIMSLAQSMGASQPQEPKEQPAQPPPPAIDPGLLQSLSAAASAGGVDQNQQALLSALSPFLSRERVNKLERAMRAAQIAGAASSFLSAGGLGKLTGR